MVAGYPGATNRLRDRRRGRARRSTGGTRAASSSAKRYVALLEQIGKDDADVAIKGDADHARPEQRAHEHARARSKAWTRGGLGAHKEQAERSSRRGSRPTRRARTAYGDVLERARGVLAEKKRDARRRRGARRALADELAVALRRHDRADGRGAPEAGRRARARLPGAQLEAPRAEPGAPCEKRYDRELDYASLLKLALQRAATPAREQNRAACSTPLVGQGRRRREASRRAVDGSMRRPQLEDSTTRVELLKKATTAELKKQQGPADPARARAPAADQKADGGSRRSRSTAT